MKGTLATTHGLLSSATEREDELYHTQDNENYTNHTTFTMSTLKSHAIDITRSDGDSKTQSDSDLFCFLGSVLKSECLLGGRQVRVK